jgi:hypothetical protein
LAPKGHPAWTHVVVSGLLLAACGELSWLSLVFPNLLFFIPLTRFPGVLWLIAIGFLLPRSGAEARQRRAQPLAA